VTTLNNARGHAAPTTWPLSPIEELSLYLESADEPNVIQLETHVRGHLDRATLESALVTALADPAARRRVAATPGWRRRVRWESAAPVARPTAGAGRDSSLTTVAWSSAEELTALRERLAAWPMPPRDGVMRLILAAGPERDVLILQTHHAAFDGISSLALLTAICDAYRDHAGTIPAPSIGSSAPPACPDLPAGSPRTGRAGTAAARIAAGIPGAITRIAARGGRPGLPGYGSVQRSIPVPRPVRHGDGPFPTVNDVLVTALILTVDRWNAAHGRPSRRRSGRRISISVPVNDRDPRERWTGPGNQTRLIRITASPGESADPAVLLAAVVAQIRAGRARPRPGLDGASRLLATSWAPAVIKRQTTRWVRRLAAPVCTDTALASNLGAIPHPPSFGGAGPEPLWFSGPAQMPRGLGVGAVTVGGRLHLCVHYQHALLGHGAAEHFTTMYCHALSELAALDQGSPA
jgi:NRPS condensation-like uncharacterized protein